jgi:hypothetical protein
MTNTLPSPWNDIVTRGLFRQICGPCPRCSGDAEVAEQLVWPDLRPQLHFGYCLVCTVCGAARLGDDIASLVLAWNQHHWSGGSQYGRTEQDPYLTDAQVLERRAECMAIDPGGFGWDARCSRELYILEQVRSDREWEHQYQAGLSPAQGFASVAINDDETKRSFVVVSGKEEPETTAVKAATSMSVDEQRLFVAEQLRKQLEDRHMGDEDWGHNANVLEKYQRDRDRCEHYGISVPPLSIKLAAELTGFDLDAIMKPFRDYTTMGAVMTRKDCSFCGCPDDSCGHTTGKQEKPMPQVRARENVRVWIDNVEVTQWLAPSTDIRWTPGESCYLELCDRPADHMIVPRLFAVGQLIQIYDRVVALGDIPSWEGKIELVSKDLEVHGYQGSCKLTSTCDDNKTSAEETVMHLPEPWSTIVANGWLDYFVAPCRYCTDQYGAGVAQV